MTQIKEGNEKEMKRLNKLPEMPKLDKCYRLSDKNAFPFMIFEQIKQKENKVTTKETFQTIDALDKENTLTNNKFAKTDIGVMITNFMNNYDVIIERFEYIKNKVSDFKSRQDYFIYHFSILVGLYRLNDKLESMFMHIINKFYYQTLRTEKLENMEEKYIQFLQDMINQMKNIKSLIDNSFATSSAKTRTKLFTNQTLQLPKVKISYSTERGKSKITYVYQISKLSDFFNTSIYHLLADNKVITRCPSCKAYFIPNDNEEKYCYGNYGINKGKCKGRTYGFFPIANQYYDRLCRRLKPEKYPNDRKELQDKYNKIKTIVKKESKTQYLGDKQLMEMLKDFEIQNAKKHNKEEKWKLYEVYEKQFVEYYKEEIQEK